MSKPNSPIAQTLQSLRLGTVRTHDGLTMIPLLGGSAEEPPHVTLDDALSSGGARVTEVSEGGTVPELAFENGGARPVFLLDGEELVGAKQNRILNLSLLVAVGARVRIPVSCVEEGRWSWRSRDFRSSGSVLFLQARRDKTRDVSYSLTQDRRRHSNQGDVWRHVAAYTSRLDAFSDTHAMSDVYARVEKPLESFAAALAWEPGQCGAAFLLGGRVAGLEAFSHQATARRLHEKLLRSYAVECIASGATAAGEAAPEDAVREFMTRVGKADEARFPALGLGEDVRLTARGLTGASLVHDGTVVHLAAFQG